MDEKGKKDVLTRYLSPIGAWALAFGCSVGWGSFVMPGTTFLPTAGPLGSVLGIALGAVLMLIIGANYHYMMNRLPGAGGTYTYAAMTFGHDHGFLSAWFLVLTYVAIIWANATALPLIARNLLGDMFQIEPHYVVAGYTVYMGEVLLALTATVLAALVCLRRRFAIWVQIVMAVILFAGVTAGVVAAVVSPEASPVSFTPAFSPERRPVSGVFTVLALAPWAYVGFESISHSSGEFTFPVKKSFRILAVAVVTGGFAYAALVLLASSVLPEGCSSWTEYIFHLGEYDGIEGLPTFFAAETLMGRVGLVLLGFTTVGGIVTGLIGNTVAASRLLYALAEDELLPDWFGRVDEKSGAPKNAILFLLAVSVILPLFGRTAISWIVDVTTVGATIAYAYASVSAFSMARSEKNRLYTVTGGAGLAVSQVFLLYFLVPNLLSVTTLSTESYLILAAWGILGFFFYMYLFRRDDKNRLGRSTISWIVLLALIIFTSTVWMRQATQTATEQAIVPIQQYYTEQLAAAGVDSVTAATRPAAEYLHDVMDGVEGSLSRYSLIQTLLIIVALIILFRIYNLMLKREKQLEVDKVLAEESSRAKTSFLSNMSHEIRTPMNAIIGLDNIALRDPDLAPHTREQLEKIGASAKHLLGLINDILDMSRIESGRMTLKDAEFSFRDFLSQINVMINGQCADKGLHFDCRIIGNVDDYYVGDDMKLKQVLINILGNAVKFTPESGSVTFTVEQTARFEGYCTMRFIIADTGIGMSKEYIPKIFEAFSQENSGTSNKYGSTGLGMAITKNIVEMMNGEIHVNSEKGVGTTFTVTVTLKSSTRSVDPDRVSALPKGLVALILDDDPVACDHAKLVANAIGIEAETTLHADDALRMIREKREAGTPYSLVLTDFVMPDMDGIAFTRELRSFDGGETPVIILTGYSFEETRAEAQDAGVDGIMSKPLFTDNLLREVQNVFEHRQHSTDQSGSVLDSASPEHGALEGLHVLVAEDMEINAEILIDLLDMEGITAEHAENGRIAVEMFEASEPMHFQAVLMDVRMPEMDGLEATRAIRALDREDARTVPIIAMTANAFDDDVQRSLQAGMTAHLSKPVEPERLYETLQRLTRD